MKTLEFIYNENAIHFLVNPTDRNVMINATEMAKPFGKRVQNFMRLDTTVSFINELRDQHENKGFDYSHVSNQNIPENIFNTTNKASFMHRKLALKFAAWLDVKFEMWVIDTIDEVIFGNYHNHWRAHAKQEMAKVAMEELKYEILSKPTPESVARYFEYEKDYKKAKNAKTAAIRNQLKLFGQKQD